MPAFGRVNGAWVESDLRSRDAGAWTDERDSVFGRLAGAWVQVQPEPLNFLPPADFAAIPTSNAVSLTWTDPSQDTVPTHVQYRLPTITPVWTEYVYGTNTVVQAGLSPATPYQAQVRYVVRSETDGQVEQTSATATVFFSTLALAGPGTPAPDPGGMGGDSVTPVGTTGGTPGPVGGSDCWWQYTIQQFDPDTYEWSDSSLIVDVEVNGDIGQLSYNFVDEGFACAEVLRWKYREVCNGVPEDWQYGTAWTVICSYDDTCGGMNQTASFTAGAWTDAIFAMPKVCFNPDTFKTEIVDYITDTLEYGRLSAFNLPLYITPTWELRAKNDLSVYGEPLVAGDIPGLVPIGSAVPSLTSDMSFTMELWVEEQPTETIKVAQISDTIRAYIIASGAGFTVSVVFGKEGGGIYSLASSTVLTIQEWHSFTVTIDQDGDKLLYIDTEVDVTDADTTRAAFDGITDNVELYANDRMRVRRVGAWDRALTADEVSGLISIQQFDFSYGRYHNANTGAFQASSVNDGDTIRRWHMPEVVGTMQVTMQGSSGGSVFGSPTSGKGAKLVATTDNTAFPAGTQLEWEVGSAHTSSARPAGAGGIGTNADAASGGGMTYLRESPFGVANAKLVAGGGGGETWGSQGANGGDAGLTGASASDGDRNVGSGATQIAGGTGGTGGDGLAEDGAQGYGGNSDTSVTNDGGGGGGGWYGGGGGGGSSPAAEGGGGGSSYIDATKFTLVSEEIVADRELGYLKFDYTHQFQAGLIEAFKQGPTNCWTFADALGPFIAEVVQGSPGFTFHGSGTSVEGRLGDPRAYTAPDGEAYMCPANLSSSGWTASAMAVATEFDPRVQAYSAVVWFKQTGVGAGPSIEFFSHGDSASTEHAAVRFDSARNLVLDCGSVSDTTLGIISDHTIDTDWHMIAMTMDASGNVEFYFDGVSIHTGLADAETIAAPTSFYLWSSFTTESPPDENIAQGPIILYQKELTAAQILSQYNAFMGI